MQHLREKAFTLLELSIVLVIISVVMGGAMVLFNQSIDERQLQETQVKMAAIQKALLNYRQAFNRIPCPADVTQDMNATSNNYFGVEAASSGTGTCIIGTPAANFFGNIYNKTGNITNGSTVITSVALSTAGLVVGNVVSGTGIPIGTSIVSVDSATQVTLDTAATATTSGVTFGYNSLVGGMVPTKTLRLPDDYAIDGWGRRIMYMVDVNLTNDAGFSKVPITDNYDNRIIVRDVAAVWKTQSAVYLLLSHGKNGHGAYPRNGGTTRLANYISADADELVNCHCDSSATATSFTSIFVQKPSSIGSFDDIVLYGTRADLRSLNE